MEDLRINPMKAILETSKEIQEQVLDETGEMINEKDIPMEVIIETLIFKTGISEEEVRSLVSKGYIEFIQTYYM